MKKLLLYLSLFVIALLPLCAIAQTWNVVGTPYFSSNARNDISIAIDRTGVPYVAFADYTYYVDMAAKVTVMKYNGTTWETVGNAGFSAGRADYISIAIDGNNVPYVTYTDVADSDKATVMKFDNGNWERVGASPANAFTPIIKTDHNGVPYVIYSNGHDGPVAVMKHDGTNWVTVGTGNLCSYPAYPCSIAFDNNNMLYVSFSSYAGYGTTTMKFDGSSWTSVGATLMHGTGGVAIDKNGVPYAPYSDSANIGVMRYNGTNWETECMHSIYHPVLGGMAIDTSGAPYILYLNTDSGQKAAMIKYNQDGCGDVGSGTFSPDGAQSVAMAVDLNSIPYVAFENYYGVTVMRYGVPPAIVPPTPTFSEHLFPNPATSQLTISWPNTITAITIYNTLGQTVYSNSYNAQEVTVDIAGVAKGVYFVRINGAAVRKFAKE